MQRNLHVDDVAAAQVELGRTARALSDHEVVLRTEAVERFGDDRPQVAPARAKVVRRGASNIDSAANDDLGPPGWGSSRMGFMSTVGSTPAATACAN